MQLFASKLQRVDLEVLKVFDDYAAQFWSTALKEAKTYTLPEHLWDVLDGQDEEDYATQAQEDTASEGEAKMYAGIKRAMVARCGSK